MLSVLAAIAQDNPVEQLLDSLVEVVQSAIDYGESKGENWGVLFPVFVAALLALVVVSGFRFVGQKAESVVKAIFTGALILLALLVLNEIRTGGFSDGDPGGDAQTTNQ